MVSMDNRSGDFMTGYILFVAIFVWIVSYVRLPKWTFPQVNVVQRSNFATLNSIFVIVVYIMFMLANG